MKEKPEQSPASDAEPQAPANEDEMAKLRQRAAEREQYFDLYRRAAADYQNLRKRMEKDVAARTEDSLIEIVEGLIVVLDHLDLALRSATESEGPLKDGVALIRSQIETLLTKQGVQPVSSRDALFDPRFHESVGQEIRAGVKPGTVIEEVRKGYRWRDRVVRPAQVRIAGAENPTEPS